MSILNKYYILSLPEPALNAIIAHTDIVDNDVNNIRKSTNQSKVIIKIKIGINNKPSVIPGNPTQYDHAGIIAELQNSEWITPIE